MKRDGMLGYVFIICVFFTLVSFCTIMLWGNPNPTIAIEASDEIDVEESLQMTSEEYIPLSTITIINDTSFMNNLWRVEYSETEDRSTIWRYVSIPLRNVTEVIVGASFRIEEADKNIGLYSDGWLYIEDTSHSGQNETLTYSAEPTEITQIRMNIVREFIRVEFEGDYRESLAVTGFWIKVILNDTLYPISIGMLRTNGEGIFSDPTTQDTQLFGGAPPYIEFITQNDDYFAFYFLTQMNDLILLPSGNYTFRLRWHTYQTNATVIIPERISHILWRIHSVRVNYQLAQEVPGYIVDLWDSDYYSLSQSPVLILPSGTDYIINVRGDHCYAQLTTALGINRNITVWVNPNFIALGPFIIMPTTILLIVMFSSMVFAIGIVGIWCIERRKKSSQLMRCVVFEIN